MSSDISQTQSDDVSRRNCPCFTKPYDSVSICGPCLGSLAEQMAAGATDDEDLRARAIEQAKAIIERDFGPGVIPSRVATTFGRMIGKVTGNPDPFGDWKRREIASARRALAALTLPSAMTDLFALAAAGNSVDFFKNPEKVVEELTSPVNFAIDDRVRFVGMLEFLAKRRGRLFYLADNASEALFDWPVLGALARMGLDVTYVVKGGPVQNDCTGKDLESMGLRAEGFVVRDNGTDAVGTDLEQCSSEFVEALFGVDAILAKGMANFETLREAFLPPTLFLLKAKCEVNAGLLDVPVGSAVAVLKEESREGQGGILGGDGP